MKPFMIIYKVKGEEQGVLFADKWDEAKEKALRIELDRRGFTEIYGYEIHEEEDEDEPNQYVLICNTY